MQVTHLAAQAAREAQLGCGHSRARTGSRPTASCCCAMTRLRAEAQPEFKAEVIEAAIEM
jgi:hypothetical protein